MVVPQLTDLGRRLVDETQVAVGHRHRPRTSSGVGGSERPARRPRPGAQVELVAPHQHVQPGRITASDLQPVEGGQGPLDRQVAAPSVGRGWGPLSRRTSRAVRTRSCSMAQTASLSPIRAALMASRSVPASRSASASNESRAVSISATSASSSRARWVTSLSSPGSPASVSTPGAPRRLASTSAMAAATWSRRGGSGSESANRSSSAWASASAAVTSAPAGGRRSDGRRSTAMIPHMG